MFSITTMASSTTKPVQIASAINERLSTLYFNRYIIPKVATMDKGTAMLGITVAQTLRKKMKITITTSATVSSSVNSISFTEARIVLVRSEVMASVAAGGI